MMRNCLLPLLFLFSSCTHSYIQAPSTISTLPSYIECAQTTDYCLLIFVDARRLDYSDADRFLRSLKSQPRNLYGRFGHAWICLKGLDHENNPCYIEGGHSGELGFSNPQYFDGVMDLVDAGDPDPIRFLWETQPDGYFEEGSGRHHPNYGVKIDLTREQYEAIKDFVSSQNYEDYAITGNQCSSFVAQVAAIAGIDLAYEITLQIPPTIQFGGRTMTLWKDPCYSQITFGSPDVIEQSLKLLVLSGKAQCVVRQPAF